MANRSGQKGRRFENEVCKSLSLWVSGGNRIDLFVPSRGSGSKATAYREKGLYQSQSGDIAATDPEGFRLTNPWFVECKNYHALELSKLIYTHLDSSQLNASAGRPPLLLQFFRKAEEEAQPFDKNVLLIVKEFRQEPLAVFHENVIEQIRRRSYPAVPELLFLPSITIAGLSIRPFNQLTQMAFEVFERLTRAGT